MLKERKIAIMMLIHRDTEQERRLINHLSKDFDVYVHIDKRTSVEIENAEGVFVYKKYKTYWGSFNQIMATLFLLKKAFENRYERYILISGQDLPITTNEKIKMFFENNNKEYLGFVKIPNPVGWPDLDRIIGYQINCFNRKSLLFKILKKTVSSVTEKIMPRKLDYDFYGGSSWTNYTDGCVKKILEYLENNPAYIKRFKWTYCADEIFYHTIINQLDGIELVNATLRYADWSDSSERPKTLKKEDYEKIMSSDRLFARKFDLNVDNDIIEMIYKDIEK